MAVTGHPDYAYALGFLERLNDVSYRGKPLRNSFFYGEYNLWHSYQQLLFEDIKRYSKTRSFTEMPRLTFLGACTYLVCGVFMGVSSIAAVFKLLLFRTPVLIYSIDRNTSVYRSDFRLSTLYQFLHERSISYVELLHTVPGRVMYQRAFARRRAALYLEFFDFLFWIASFFSVGKETHLSAIEHALSSFSKNERCFARHLIKVYVRRVHLTQLKIRWMRAILTRSHLKVVFAIDDARYYSELFLAARYAGIKTYALQHGHFTRYHVGWLWDPSFEGEGIAPDVFLAWSDYWRKELIRLGTHFPPSSIIIGGSKELPQEMCMEKSKAEHEDGLVVLIPYETACPKDEVVEYIEAMLACKNIDVIFKIRPDRSPHEQVVEYGINDANARISVVSNTKEAIDAVDVVVGVYSTYLYEMVVEGKPVGILETSSDYGMGMVHNELADIIRKASVCDDLACVAKLPCDKRNARRGKLLGDPAPLLHDALAGIAGELELDKI